MLTKQKVVVTDYDEQDNLVRRIEEVEIDVPEGFKLSTKVDHNPYLLVVKMTVNGLEPMYNTIEELEYRMFDSQFSVCKYFPAMSRGKYNFKLAPLTTGEERIVEMSMTSPEPPESGMSIHEWITYVQDAVESSVNASKIDWEGMFPNGNGDDTSLSIVVAHSGNGRYGTGNWAVKLPLSINGKYYSCTLITISDTTTGGQSCLIHSFGHELMHGANVMDLYFQTFWEWIGPFGIMSVSDRAYKGRLIGIDPFSATMNDWYVAEEITSFPSTKTITERGQYLHVQLTENDVYYLIEKRPDDDYDRFYPNKFFVWRMNTKLMPIAYQQRNYDIAYLDPVERFCHYVTPAGMDNSSLGAVEAGTYGDGTHKLPYLNITISGNSITINKADKDGNIDNSRPILPDPVYEKLVVADIDNCIAGGGLLKIKVQLPAIANEDTKVLAYFSRNYFEKTGTLIDGYYVFDTDGFTKTLDSVSFRLDDHASIATPFYDIDLKLDEGGGGTTPVIGVTLSKSSHTFTDYTTLQLTANILPSGATNKNVTWSSSNTSIATVSNGLVTAKANGNCTITVTTEDGNKTATCSITVNKEEEQPLAYVSSNLGTLTVNKADTNVAVTSVTLNQPSLSLNVGGNETLVVTVLPPTATNKSVTWSSSNSSVAGVSYNGTVTAYSAGNCTITVTTEDGNKTATCSVTVTSPITPVSSVSVSPSSKTLEIGENFTLTANVLPSGATNKNVTWSSSNSGVVGVSYNGTLTAYSAGTSTITATTEDGGKTATCSVTVNAVAQDPISINNISDLNVNENTPFNIVYSTNVTATKHEISFDGGSSYVIIYPTNSSTTYTYQHEGLTTEWNPVQRKIRVTDSNGNSAVSNSFNVYINGGGGSTGGYSFLESMFGNPRVEPNLPPGYTPDAGELPYINAHEDKLTPNGVSDTKPWKFGTRRNTNPSHLWTRVGWWGQVFKQSGHTSAVSNAAIEITDCKLWGWNNDAKQWVLMHDVEFDEWNTKFYDEAFSNDMNGTFPNNLKINGKSVTAKFDSANMGYCFHPYSNGKKSIYDYNITYPLYYCSTMKARLVKWDSGGADNLDSAKFLFNTAGDYWHTTIDEWQSDWSANGEFAQGQFLKVTRDWRTAYATNVPEDWSNGFPTVTIEER